MTKEMRELLNKRSNLLVEAETAKANKNSEVFQAKLNEVKELDKEIDALKDFEALQGKFSDDNREMVTRSQATDEKKKDESKRAKIDQIRSSNEYAQAFCNALAAGYNVKTGRSVSELNPLYNALTESGGTPAGADGGFLVPIDIDNAIKELRRASMALANYVNVENVTTLSGWRAVESGKAAQPFAKVVEMGTIGAAEQPTFTKLEYAVEKYAGILPVSNELISDNAANLLNYLARWMNSKNVLTENSLILAIINAMTAVPFVTADGIANIKTALNVTLDPAISINSIILTNQDGYNYLDNLEDAQGRPLLQPDPTNATGTLFKGRRIVTAPNVSLPTRHDGTLNKDFAPVVIGDLIQLMTLFRRNPFEVASTNIGGNAWATDSTEIRGIVRLDAAQADADAAVKLEIEVA